MWLPVRQKLTSMFPPLSPTDSIQRIQVWHRCEPLSLTTIVNPNTAYMPMYIWTVVYELNMQHSPACTHICPSKSTCLLLEYASNSLVWSLLCLTSLCFYQIETQLKERRYKQLSTHHQIYQYHKLHYMVCCSISTLLRYQMVKWSWIHGILASPLALNFIVHCMYYCINDYWHHQIYRHSHQISRYKLCRLWYKLYKWSTLYRHTV